MKRPTFPYYSEEVTASQVGVQKKQGAERGKQEATKPGSSKDLLRLPEIRSKSGKMSGSEKEGALSSHCQVKDLNNIGASDVDEELTGWHVVPTRENAQLIVDDEITVQRECEEPETRSATESLRHSPSSQSIHIQAQQKQQQQQQQVSHVRSGERQILDTAAQSTEADEPDCKVKLSTMGSVFKPWDDITVNWSRSPDSDSEYDLRLWDFISVYPEGLDCDEYVASRYMHSHDESELNLVAPLESGRYNISVVRDIRYALKVMVRRKDSTARIEAYRKGVNMELNEHLVALNTISIIVDDVAEESEYDSSVTAEFEEGSTSSASPPVSRRPSAHTSSQPQNQPQSRLALARGQNATNLSLLLEEERQREAGRKALRLIT